MVDNKGVTSISNFNFKAGDASGMANKMSDEKNGQGGEYFAQEIEEEQENKREEKTFEDRSAQLRASLNGLAMANAGSIIFAKKLKEKMDEMAKIKKGIKEEISEEIFDE